MANLKALRIRINSVRSTQKITSAMKLVAASKLRRAQAQMEAARPYAERLAHLLAALAPQVASSPTAPALLVGTRQDRTHLLVAVTAERGLAGAFNANVGRTVRQLKARLEAEGKVVKVATIGRKGRDFLRRDVAGRFAFEVSFAGKKQITFEDAHAISERIGALLAAGEFDVCTLIYNRFVSVISQQTIEVPLIPTPIPAEAAAGSGPRAVYEFEPEEETLLAALLPQYLATQIYRALIESAAGEQGAR